MSTVSKICASLVAIFTLAVLVTLVTRGTLPGAGGPGPPPDIGSGVSGPIAASPEGVARDSREAIVGAVYPEPESGGDDRDDGDAEADVRSMHLVVLDGSTNRPVPEASVVGARATWETDAEGRVQCATAGILWVRTCQGRPGSRCPILQEMGPDGSPVGRFCSDVVANAHFASRK